MELVLTVRDEELRRAARKFVDKGADGRVPLGKFWHDFYIRTSAAWEKITVKSGGDFRGEYWKPMKIQYKRKDGTEVPAWGGVPLVRYEAGSATQIKWLKSGKLGKKRRLVNAEGKRISGLVKGRLRQGRKTVRVKSTDTLMADTGSLRKSMFGPKPQGGINRQGPDTVLLAFPKDDLTYAERQNDMRHFAFWEDAKDEALLYIHINWWLDSCAREFNDA